MTQDITPEGNIVVVWGSTGSGKSTLANRLIGLEYDLNGNPTTANQDQEHFAISSDPESITRETKLKSGMWFGDSSYGHVTVIDTPGLGDSAGPGQDSINISNMIKFLKSVKPGIHLFVLVFNGSNPRFDNNLQELIKLFDKMFSSQIWNNVALCFTKHPQDARSRFARAKEHGAPAGTADEKELWVQKKIGSAFVDHIKTYLAIQNFPQLPYIFVDSVPLECDDEKLRETTAQDFRILNQFAGTRDPFSCSAAVLVKRTTEELLDQVRAQLKEKEDLQKKLEFANEQRVEMAVSIQKMAEDKLQAVEAFSKATEEKARLVEELKRETEDRALRSERQSEEKAKELEEKIRENERMISEKASLIESIKSMEERATFYAKQNEERAGQLQDKIEEINRLQEAHAKEIAEAAQLQHELTQRIKQKEEEELVREAARRALENSIQIQFKESSLGKKYSDKVQPAQLQFLNCTSGVLEDVLYRVVHISNSQVVKAIAAILTVGTVLPFVGEDSFSPEVYQQSDSYFAYQEFRIAQLRENDIFLCAQPLEFVPHEKGFGNLYHFVSARYVSISNGKTEVKATKRNWFVRMYECDALGSVKLSIYDTWVNITSPSGNSYVNISAVSG